jgi:hypothetical protein
MNSVTSSVIQYSDIFDRIHWESIENKVIEQVLPFIKLNIKAKLISELISELTEKITAEYFSQIYSGLVKSATSDNDPDLMFGDIPLEVKVAKYSNGFNWRGGKFSKRQSDYIFIVWDFDTNDKTKIKVAVYKAFLSKDNWIQNRSSNYYATLYNMNLLSQNTTMKCIIGDITFNKNNNARPLFEYINS